MAFHLSPWYTVLPTGSSTASCRALPSLRCCDYGPFNCSISHTHSWSRYYRGCWHQTCPPILLPLFAGHSHTRLVTASSQSGQFSRLLPSLDVGAVSQAPSPAQNPHSPSTVAALVVHYTANKLIVLRLVLPPLSHIFTWLSARPDRIVAVLLSCSSLLRKHAWLNLRG